MLSTDGASAGDKAMTVTPTAATDGLELWISVCNTLGSACNNPQNGVYMFVCLCLSMCICLYTYICSYVYICAPVQFHMYSYIFLLQNLA